MTHDVELFRRFILFLQDRTVPGSDEFSAEGVTADQVQAHGQALREAGLADLFDDSHLKDRAPRRVLGLTSAELRLVPLLTTHHSFREIGQRLYVSQHTVKSQAISIYRKLGVSSRGQAVQRVQEIGLLAM